VMKQRNAGFTLIEMMVALAIGGILTAMAVPSINAIRDTYRLRSAAQDVFMALQKARMGAVKENNQFLVSFSGATYTSHNDLNNNGVQDAGEPLTTHNLANDMPDLDVGWTGIGGAAGVTFAPNGTAPSVGTISISDGNSMNTKNIRISPAGIIQIF
jgi:type IV fimbrial biogenesis protein FimT